MREARVVRSPVVPEQVLFAVLSFEGPDRYAQAGGLGVRVTHLAETLAQRGFLTHLFFVGDPAAPGVETRLNGRLILHRWCQWISMHHPAGVYDGEEGKLRDLSASLPPFLIEHIIRPALAAGQVPVILAEEWHTAEALIRLSDLLHRAGVRQRCVLFWNANNTMGFHRVDWPRLNFVAQLTTVSRYMKHLMWQMGLNPLVIPNGIPAGLLQPVDPRQVESLRRALGADHDAVMLFKVGRFDPAKRWLMAVEASAMLKSRGLKVVFPIRGGIEAHGHEVLARARALGLHVTDISGNPDAWEDFIVLLRDAPRADVYNLRFPLAQTFLRPLYAAADAVLATSGHEPFGLVGLEAMAAGGLVLTGATGEEYTLGGRGAVVLDTDRPEEIVIRLLDLRAQPARAKLIRQIGRRHAASFTWERVTDLLLDTVSFVAQASGALPSRRGPGSRRVGRAVSPSRDTPASQAHPDTVLQFPIASPLRETTVAELQPTAAGVPVPAEAKPVVSPRTAGRDPKD